MEQMVTTKELAEILKVSTRTIASWRTKGLPFKKIGGAVRFDLEEVKAWIEKE